MSAGEGSGAFEAPERWQRLREVLEEALERPRDEREPWLREACSGDAELEREARRLLALEEGSRQLEPPTASELALDPPAVGPRSVGPWALLREIGRGGMGSVWLARRADGAYERRVALKILHARPGSGVPRERLLERFRRERQVLANLEHPNIARLLEGGETEDGEPYLVMEYVEGRPVDRHCDEERLPLEARLELFGKVCDAVQYAHRNLVVHRDLKPGNVLVTPDGEPKLLDFGIAKVLDAEKSSSAPELTLGLMHFLTPAYASPEQVTGRPITTASDVYSLGVVLYQLLAGELPHRVETTSAAEIERIVCGEEPSAPSAAVARAGEDRAEAIARARLTTPRALRRALAGDLDNVVLTALRVEPWRRYASAERLAEDLRRHLDGLPVTARPDTFGYRAGKLLRRHRAACTAAALVLLSLVVGLVTTARQSVRAERARESERVQRELAEARLAESERLAADLAEQRTTAEARLAEVQQLNAELERQSALAQARFDDVRGFATRLIFDVHRAIHPLEGATQAIELVVSTGIESLDRLAAQAGDDADLARELGQAYLRMAEIQGSTGDANTGQAEAARSSVDKAHVLAAGLVAAAPDDARNAALLAHVLLMRGDLARADGRSVDAQADHLAALEACRGIAELADPKPGHLSVLQAVQSRLADFLAERSCGDEVRERYESCIAIVQRLVDGWPQLATMESQIGELHADLALWHARCGRLDEALAANDRALEILERLAGRAPAHAPLQRHAHAARCQRASLLTDLGELERAAPLLDEGRRFFAAQLEADPSNVRAREDLILTWRRTAALNVHAGDWDAARRAWEEQLELVQPVLSGERGRARDRLLLADVSAGLGEALVQQDLFLEAGPHLERAREVLEQLATGDPEDVTSPYMLSNVYALLGRAHARAAEQGARAARASELERAVEWLERALATGETVPGELSVLQLDRLEDAREDLERCRADLAALRQP